MKTKFSMKSSEQNIGSEWVLASRKKYPDPFNDVEVSAVVIDPDGRQRQIPAFWSGDGIWRLRYSSEKIGEHSIETVCSDPSNTDLHGREGKLRVIKYKGKNPLFLHGPLRTSQDRRHLEHIDGTPFFWLGDTWWMGLTKRLPWPEGFKLLTKDRVNKGFTVVQIVAGLYPDMPPFDPRGANEAGFPWEKDFSTINPKYFNMADRRICWLVQNGIVPCVVGCWGYFMEFAGESVIRNHWRNLVARYGSSPVVWCVAGEATMPYYLSPAGQDEGKRNEYVVKVRANWTNVARYIRTIDAHSNPITLHPGGIGTRTQVNDPAVVDIDMLQPGHDDLHAFPSVVDQVVGSYAQEPTKPVVVGEACYEGEYGENWENVQRLNFWASILSGAAGFTYGANGIWQVNTKERRYGISPWGGHYGDAAWDDARRLPGSGQVGFGRKFLGKYQWWRFEPHPEWVEPHWDKGDYFRPFAGGIPDVVRFIYIPVHAFWQAVSGMIKTRQMKSGLSWSASYFDPRSGDVYEVGTVIPDERGELQLPKPPIVQDWVLVIEAGK